MRDLACLFSRLWYLILINDRAVPDRERKELVEKETNEVSTNSQRRVTDGGDGLSLPDVERTMPSGDGQKKRDVG